MPRVLRRCWAAGPGGSAIGTWIITKILMVSCLDNLRKAFGKKTHTGPCVCNLHMISHHWTCGRTTAGLSAKTMRLSCLSSANSHKIHLSQHSGERSDSHCHEKYGPTTKLSEKKNKLALLITPRMEQIKKETTIYTKNRSKKKKEVIAQQYITSVPHPSPKKKNIPSILLSNQPLRPGS